uniref:Uncharacterized protein n=1 Tax=Tetranychus urticae TaxID=32264 RepID=T1K403_TETUR
MEPFAEPQVSGSDESERDNEVGIERRFGAI